MLPIAITDYQCKFLIINMDSLSHPKVLTLTYNRDNGQVQTVVKRGAYSQHDYDLWESMLGESFDMCLLKSGSLIHHHSSFCLSQIMQDQFFTIMTIKYFVILSRLQYWQFFGVGEVGCSKISQMPVNWCTSFKISHVHIQS